MRAKWKEKKEAGGERGEEEERRGIGKMDGEGKGRIAGGRRKGGGRKGRKGKEKKGSRRRAERKRKERKVG